MNLHRSLLLQAIELSRQCVATDSAFSVGCIIADSTGRILSTGFSRELGEKLHAEEVALFKTQQAKIDIQNCILYSSLEPCSMRASSPKSCTALILESGITTVVFACREPNRFVDCQGAEQLANQSVLVLEHSEYAEMVLEINKHLLK